MDDLMRAQLTIAQLENVRDDLHTANLKLRADLDLANARVEVAEAERDAALAREASLREGINQIRKYERADREFGSAWVIRTCDALLAETPPAAAQ